MPTIDQLPPATAASDTDEFVVTQSGIAVKVTRAQVLSGVQSQLAPASGTLLGRISPGLGAPESIAIGANLMLANGSLSATAIPFQVGVLPQGTVPGSGDLVPLGQNNTNTAVTYSQFMNGLSSIGNINASAMLVQPTGATKTVKLADFAASTLATSGGSMTGALTLATDPVVPLQAATKEYVDGQVATSLPKSGGTLSGALVLSSDPNTTLQAATKNYVDTQLATALPKSGGTLSGALVLAGDPTTSLQASTKSYADARVLRSGDSLTGPLVLAADPTSALQAATKGYVDNQVANTLPRSGGTLTGALTLAADPTASLQAATKHYVDSQSVTGLPTSGGVLTGPLTLAADPSAALQAATKGYVDNQVGTTLPKSGGTLTGTLTLAADPTSSLQAATKHYVDSQSVTGLPTSGGTLTGPLTLATSPTAAMQAATKQYVDGQVATSVPLTGGTLTGALTLAANPSVALGAATKQYVDFSTGASGVINVKSPPYSAQLNGVTDDTAAFKAAYQAAPVGSVIYVPNGITNLQNPNNWGISLTKWVKWIVDGTTLPNGTSLADAIPGGGSPSSFVLPGLVVGNSSASAEASQGASQATDFAVSRSAYIVNHTGGSTGVVATNTRADTIIYNSPNNYIWGGLDRLLWVGVQTPSAATPAQHVARYVQTVRQSVGTNSSGQPLPQPQLWAACLEYRDTTGQPSSVTGSSITVEMDWMGNGPDDGKLRQIQSLVIGQANMSGAPVEVSTVIGIYLGGGSTGHAYQVFTIGLPFSTSVLDTTGAQQLSGAAAIRMAAGHKIAFEPTNSNSLAYDSTTSTLRWNQGTLSYVVGKGITVGFQNVCSGNTTLPYYVAGNIVFLVGGSTYTITLPPASTVAAGTGFTFSNLTSGVVTIMPTGTDSIDNPPVTLRQNDRYHIISDGSACWREVFRTNFVNPRFVGTPTLPSYTVAGLPAATTPGSLAYASNGRKPGESAGAGTGVQAFSDGTRWVSVGSGTQVVA